MEPSLPISPNRPSTSLRHRPSWSTPATISSIPDLVSCVPNQKLPLGHMPKYIEKNMDILENMWKYINLILQNIKIYANIYKYVQDIQDTYKMLGGGGPGRAAAAWYFVYILHILYIFVYICIYFKMFWYILIHWVLNWYSINIQFGIRI